MLFTQPIESLGGALLIADAAGLALFAISGAQMAEAARFSPFVVVLMGTITGVAGGVMRDVLTGKVPLILQRDIYASAAIAGICVYLSLQAIGIKRPVAVTAGIITIIAIRLAAIRWNLQLPVFHTG